MKRYANIVIIKQISHCDARTPKENNEVLEYTQSQKSIKTTFINNVDSDPLLEKIHIYKNNPKKLSTTKVSKHTTYSYSIFTESTFDNTKHEHDHYRAKDCMKKFCKDLKKHTMKIIIKKGNDTINKERA